MATEARWGRGCPKAEVLLPELLELQLLQLCWPHP